MQFAIVSVALITWMFLVFPGADSDDMNMDSEADPGSDGDKGDLVAECLKKHGGRCVKTCDKDEAQIQNCAADLCCAEKCD